MKTETEDLTPEQSLEIILDMIQRTKVNFKQNSFYFLFWGWIIALIDFSMFILLKYTHYSRPYLLWLIVIPAWVVSFVYGSKQDKKNKPTHLDTINMWLWISVSFSMLPIILFSYQHIKSITPFILALVTTPTFVTGIILRFKPLLFGGIIFCIFSIFCFMSTYENQFLLSGLAVIIGYLVPGYMLKKQK
jgi:hypothetical protein